MERLVEFMATPIGRWTRIGAGAFLVLGGLASGRKAQRALSIDEGLAEAHTSLGYTQLFYDWDPREAHQEFQRALALQPTYASA